MLSGAVLLLWRGLYRRALCSTAASCYVGWCAVKSLWIGVVCTWKAVVGWILTLAWCQRSPWLPVRLQTRVSVTAWPFWRRKTFRAPTRHEAALFNVIFIHHVVYLWHVDFCFTLTYMFPIHVIIKRKAVGGVVADRGAFGVECRGQQSGCVVLQPWPWCLYVHVETWQITKTWVGVRGQVKGLQTKQLTLMLPPSNMTPDFFIKLVILHVS